MFLIPNRIFVLCLLDVSLFWMCRFLGGNNQQSKMIAYQVAQHSWSFEDAQTSSKNLTSERNREVFILIVFVWYKPLHNKLIEAIEGCSQRQCCSIICIRPSFSQPLARRIMQLLLTNLSFGDDICSVCSRPR